MSRALPGILRFISRETLNLPGPARDFGIRSQPEADLDRLGYTSGAMG